MSDRVFAEISIGGNLDNTKDAESLLVAIHKEGYLDKEDIVAMLLYASATGCPAQMSGEDVASGVFPHIDLCVKDIDGLMCSTNFSSGAEFDAGDYLIDVDGKDYAIQRHSGDYCLIVQPMLGIREVSDSALLEYIKAQLDVIKKVNAMPPLTISDAVRAWLQIVPPTMDLGG